jgi:hypothetical protein
MFREEPDEPDSSKHRDVVIAASLCPIAGLTAAYAFSLSDMEDGWGALGGLLAFGWLYGIVVGIDTAFDAIGARDGRWFMRGLRVIALNLLAVPVIAVVAVLT